MYQSIDDPQEELTARKPKRNALIWLAAATGLLGIIAIVYWTSPGVSVPQQVDEFTRAEQSTYRKAISETQAPMRRARLQDFLTTYPDSDRIPSVQAQLDVIEAHETSQWIALTDIVYNAKTPKIDKIAALNSYTVKWDGALLGGRTEEIKSIHENLTGSIQQTSSPDRKLKDQKSPISKDIPDGVLAGGPKAAPPPVIIPPEPIQPPPVKVVALKIIPPKVSRNVNPRYPRKAMRRNIEATVTLKLNIDDNGKVAMTELVNVEAARYEKSFVKAAERAALRTRFHPKMVGGKAEPAVGVIKRYKFRLDKS